MGVKHCRRETSLISRVCVCVGGMGESPILISTSFTHILEPPNAAGVLPNISIFRDRQ